MRLQSTRISVSKRSSVHVTTQMTWIQRLEPCNKCARSRVNTKRVWLRSATNQQEVNLNERSHTLQTAEEFVQGDKRHNVSARKTKGQRVYTKTLRNCSESKTEVEFHKKRKKKMAKEKRKKKEKRRKKKEKRKKQKKKKRKNRKKEKKES